MIDWYLKVVRDNYANFSGRARRSEYWYYILCSVIISMILGLADYFIGFQINVLRGIYGLAVFIPGLAVLVRRMHDIGRSGWFIFTFLIPFLIGVVWIRIVTESVFANLETSTFGILIPLLLTLGGAIWMLVLLCKDGNTGVNKYGPDPKNPYESLDEIGAKETELY
jgi:uncharacterized membrane protein YhaH (DUF805 family)